MTEQKDIKAGAVKQAPQRYIYNAETNRYRDTVTGDTVTPAEMLELRDGFIDDQKDKARALAPLLGAGAITRREWVEQMRRLINDTNVAEYLAAVGGIGNFVEGDIETLRGIIRGQMERLQVFEGEVQERGRSATTAFSVAYIAARSALYMESTSQAFEQGFAAARDIKFPAYPGDGSTQCMANCRCNWVVVSVEGGFNCTWTLEPAEHCDDCLERSGRWAPLFIQSL